MNDMSSNRNYNERNYDNRGYDNRYYDEAFYGNREGYREDYRDYDNRGNYRDYDNRGNYREDYRDSYREDYREDYRRDYDRRGGKINNRNYRNYREQDYYEELEMAMQDIKEQARKLEDISEMASNQQDKTMLTKIAQKEKDNYMYLKQMSEK